MKESRVQKDAKFNKLEMEGRDWARSRQELYGFEILDGTVSDTHNVTMDDHRKAKLSKGDLGLVFGLDTLYISLKMAMKNNMGIVVPGRMHFPQSSITRDTKEDIKSNPLEYFVIDANEVKELANKKWNGYLIYFCENTNMYYAYSSVDLITYKIGEIILEPEGGYMNLEGKYKQSEPFHQKMSLEEGEPKRKFILERSAARFESFDETMKVLLEIYNTTTLNQRRVKTNFLIRKETQVKYAEYRKQIKDFMKEHEGKFIYDVVLTDTQCIVTAKQDVLLHVEDTQKKVYNDQVVFEYDLLSPDFLYMRKDFNSTEAFMNHLCRTVIPTEMKKEAEHRLELYKVRGQLQDYITIVSPSSFFNRTKNQWEGKCKGATRKEAIRCKVRFEITGLKLLKTNYERNMATRKSKWTA